MKRVLHVLSTLEQGGTESVVLNYFSHMDKSTIMFDFLVVWGEKKGYYEDSLEAQGCKIFKLKNGPNRFFAHGRELTELFRQRNYDIVHIHAMSSLRYRVAKAAKKNGVKTVIYHSHSSSNDNHLFLHKLLKPRLNKWCDYRFACSATAGRYMYTGSFEIIHNAIEVERYYYNETYRNALREEYGLENRLVIGHVGRLVNVKNQQFLLKVLPYIKKLCVDVVVFFIGEGDNKQVLLEYAEKNGLTENIVFAGTVGTDVNKYYNLFDCFAFPSKFEGLSLVLLEAQANGLPIIASNMITKENKVAENFRFLSIDETKENFQDWADAIYGMRNQRGSGREVAANGYDIALEAEKLQNFYLNH